MTDQQTALERQRALYREKNAHLDQFLEPVEPYEFYREIFPKGSFERKGHYEDAKGNAIALTVPKKQDSQENGVALEIEGDGKTRRHLITDELEELVRSRTRILRSCLLFRILAGSGVVRMPAISMLWFSIWTVFICHSSGTRCTR